MERSPADAGDFAERSLDGLVVGRIGAVALGGGVSLALLLFYAAWEYAFGHLQQLAPDSWWSPETRGPRIALTVIVLIGFLVGTREYGRRSIARDVEDLRPLLQACSSEEHAALVRQAKGSALIRGGWISSLVAAAIGLLVVTGNRTGVPFLLSGEPWSHDLVLALAFNALLFAILGRIAVETFRTNRFFGRIESRLGAVDLLRPRALAAFATPSCGSAAARSPRSSS